MPELRTPNFTVGCGDWVREMRAFTDPFDPHYWDDFHPHTTDEIDECERMVNRRLPADFRAFLLRVGSGNFSRGGGIYTPEEIVLACPGPFYSLLGSSEWATPEEHHRLYASRGTENPRPDRFTEEAVSFGGLNLFDLLQVGYDGNGGYIVLHLAPPAPPTSWISNLRRFRIRSLTQARLPRSFGYGLLVPEDVEERLPSFSDGLKAFLARGWRSANGLDEPTGLRLDLSDLKFDE
ncbi:SMI1/KNR4 family protein [Paludisphaera rhizosphaerae]|uniref:SMI1/KNR4 family protein n=1 Tax=Paludisphaera rhizosphaerae TaxID=2711216 RepID=UPI0013ECF4D9|nr:SMI1/KNR4 family protein [Paludisphaera rhizosphaerae]